MSDNCSFCGFAEVITRRCRRCGWGPEYPPFETPAWEKASFFSWGFPWLQTLWMILAHPHYFFRTLNPQGRLSKAFLYLLIPSGLFCLVIYAVMQPLYAGLPDPAMRELFFRLIPFKASDPFWVMMPAVSTVLVEMLISQILFVCLIGILIHGCLNMMHRIRQPLSLTLRLATYGSMPGFVTVVALVLLVFLTPFYLGTSPSSLNILASNYAEYVFLFTLIFWSYSTYSIALEEVLGLSRNQSRMTVALFICLSFLLLSLLMGALAG